MSAAATKVSPSSIMLMPMTSAWNCAITKQIRAKSANMPPQFPAGACSSPGYSWQTELMMFWKPPGLG